MTLLMAAATKSLSAPPERVRGFLRDYRDARPKILTPEYRDYRVEEGGIGEGTIISYTFTSPGRSRDFRQRVEESDEGLFERDVESSFVSNWTVDPTATGSSVTLEASWESAGGVGGFFERLFAPMFLRRTYGHVLDKLAGALQESGPRMEDEPLAPPPDQPASRPPDQSLAPPPDQPLAPPPDQPASRPPDQSLSPPPDQPASRPPDQPGLD